jgi:hypothetical protein
LICVFPRKRKTNLEAEMNSKLKTTIVGAGIGFGCSLALVVPRLAFSGLMVGAAIFNVVTIPLSPVLDTALGAVVGYNWKK